MRTLAILPIKSFGAAKQRLSGLLGSGSRQALAQAMFLDVLASLRRVAGIDAVAVVTADWDAETAARRSGVHLLYDPHEAGQSAAAGIGIRHGLELGFERVLLVPGDTPLIESGEITMMLQRAAEEGTAAVIVPDRHGTGTNAILLQPPDVIAPSFGPGSFARHRAGARAAGVAAHVEPLPTLVLDVDTRADLERVASVLAERPGLAPNTRAALAERAPV